MLIPRFLVITGRSLKQVTRDRRTFVMILLVPMIIMVIFGYAIGGEIKNAPVAMVIDDKAIEIPTDFGVRNVSLATMIFELFSNDSRVDVSVYKSNTDARNDVDKGKLNGAIYFPENFTLAMNSTVFVPGAQVELYVDSTIPQTQVAIAGAFRDAQLEAIELVSHMSPGELPVDVSKLQVEIIYANDGTDLSGLDVAVPSVIAFVLNFLILLLMTLLFVRERTYGTRDRLMATPLRPQEHVVGYILTGIILALAEALVIMTIAVVLFGATIRGNIVLLFIAITLFGTTFVCLGAFLSNFARNELQAVQMGPLIALPSMAISGFLVPIETLPDFLQPFSSVVPLTYGIFLFKGIMLKGHGLEELWFEFGMITAFCLAALALAILTVKETNE